MRYMMMVMGDAGYEAGETASDELQQLMGEFIGKAASQGVFVDGAGLQPSSAGFKAHSRDGKISFTDGPFTEAREIVGGFAIVELEDDAAARELARAFIEVHHKAGVMNLDCEIRPFEREPSAQ